MKITPNTHGVPMKQWNKWVKVGAHVVFNELYETMLSDQGLFTHTNAPLIPVEHWEVIAWNAAWMAAALARERVVSVRRVA